MDELLDIPVEAIRPGQYQPRIRFDEADLLPLAATIKSIGLVQRIVVRRCLDGYEIIAGERRWRAAQIAGLQRVSAIVRDLNDHEAAEQAIVENLHRKDLNPMETAEALARLISEFDLSHEEASRRIGISRVAVTHYLSLRGLDRRVRDLIAAERLTFSHGKVLAGAPPAQQYSLASAVLDKKLSVRALEKRIAETESTASTAPGADPDIARLERNLGDFLHATVRIAHTGSRTQISVEFPDLDCVQGFLDQIGFSAD